MYGAKFTFLIIPLLLTGCTSLALRLPDVLPTDDIDQISVTQTPLQQSINTCEERFIPHPLDHITTVQGDTVHLYASNGSGLAVNDLDNDGDLDIVLGNLAGKNAIFWNEGASLSGAFSTFDKQELPFGRTRGINIVDFDGDGWQDILFARQQARPTLWRNLGIPDDAEPENSHPEFAEIPNRDLWVKAYTTSWADLDSDGDLDLVAASYDTEYTRGNPGAGGGGGVAILANQGEGQFESTSLAFTTQALALLIEDLNNDGALDILVGNDFFLQDQLWLQIDGNWQEAQPFTTMSMNTMSFAAGDLDNNGQAEYFAGDMLPYQTDEATLAAWHPVVGHMEPIEGDPQIMANVLHVAQGEMGFVDQADQLGITAAGWSWSAQFGDLDNDGLLDLYIVNGMNAEELFGHLPNNELVEENLVFRNNGTGRFEPVPDWGLNSTLGGRGMSMADLDQDGDLDIVVNNLLASAYIFENRLCSGTAILVDLDWTSSQNRRAIGAQLVLHTTSGTYHRSVRAASGYLSGEPAQIHFGFPAESQVERLEVIWPDGIVSTVDDLLPNTKVWLTR